MALVRCPTCSVRFEATASSAMPFCSDRCRRIDLNRWLSEEISIPYRELPDDGSRGSLSDEEDDA